jgi:hypothetical protein
MAFPIRSPVEKKNVGVELGRFFYTCDGFICDHISGLEDELEDDQRPGQQEQADLQDDFDDDEFRDFIDDDLGEGDLGDHARRRKRVDGLPAGVSAAALRVGPHIVC